MYYRNNLTMHGAMNVKLRKITEFYRRLCLSRTSVLVFQVVKCRKVSVQNYFQLFAEPPYKMVHRRK